MTNTTQADSNIEVPVIEIAEGWTIDEVLTEDDCDDAFALLTEAITSIEYRMERLREEGASVTSSAYRKAKAALRWKKAAMQAVQNRRGQIKRQARQAQQVSRDRILLNEIRSISPDVFRQAVKSLADRGIQA